MKKRNIDIDILRTLGMILIIFAHANPPGVLFQLRNFDVILLMILSGINSVESYKNSNGYYSYIKKRLIRIVIPVWIFLFFFFLITKLMEIQFTINDIIESFLLLDGIGYVWIFKVYILIAVITPFLIYIYRKYSFLQNIFFALVIYIVYEFMHTYIGNNYFIISNYLYYLLAYSICVIIGINVKRINDKNILTLAIFFLIIFITIMFYFYITKLEIISTQLYKYPPKIYYLSYGIGMSLLSYYMISRKNLLTIKEKLDISVIKFISSHTMWIYLWHIVFIYLFAEIGFHWIIKFVLYLFCSYCMTKIQSKIVNKCGNKFQKSIFDC